jgi:hypothetical protein
MICLGVFGISLFSHRVHIYLLLLVYRSTQSTFMLQIGSISCFIEWLSQGGVLLVQDASLCMN